MCRCWLAKHGMVDSLTTSSVGKSSRYGPFVTVASRVQRLEPSRKPLAGVRITVKDMFDVKGFTTSLGSREYLALSKPATETAPAIQKLIDQGAEIVGLSKMCSMVLLQHPPHCVDFAAPFNPRGDGYQSPSGGNSGQAAAIAAYEWLDIAVGTDCKALISVYLVFPASTTQFDMRLVMTRLLTSFFSNSKRPSFSSSQWRIFPSSFSRSSFVSRHVVRCAVGRGSNTYTNLLRFRTNATKIP